MNKMRTDLVNFISEETNYPAKDIKPSTRLVNDIFILGDDAISFIEKFASKFDVTIVIQNWADSFPGEDSLQMLYVQFCTWLRIKKGYELKSEFTVADLDEAISMGVLKQKL